jgi:cytosine deaminase
MANQLLIKNVRRQGQSAADLLVRNGIIAEIGPALTPDTAGVPVIEGNNDLLIPALVEAHVHFDKTLWGLPWHGHQAGPLLTDRIAFEREYFSAQNLAPEPQAAAVVRQAIAMGSLHIRSHADVTPELGLRRVEALLAIREQFADQINLQIVAFPQLGVQAVPGTSALIDEAIALGADVVGGIDPSAIDRDPVAHLDAIFGIADRRGVGIDIHHHETGNLGAFSIELIAERTRALGLQGRVMISHAYSLGSIAPSETARLADLLAKQEIAIMTAAPGNVSFPPVKLLRDAGVTVCLGSDSIRDCWSPFGNADMLERAMLLAMRSGFRTDADLDLAFDLATYGGAHALGVNDYGVEVGCQADFVLLPYETQAETIATRGPNRRVVSAGALIANVGVYEA